MLSLTSDFGFTSRVPILLVTSVFKIDFKWIVFLFFLYIELSNNTHETMVLMYQLYFPFLSA